MKHYVCLPSMGNEEMPKRLTSPLNTAYPNPDGKKIWFQKHSSWKDVTVNDFGHKMSLTVRGLMYSAQADVNKHADLVTSCPSTWTTLSYKSRDFNEGSHAFSSCQ